MRRIEDHTDALIDLGRASEETRGPDMPTSEVGIGRAPVGIAQN